MSKLLCPCAMSVHRVIKKLLLHFIHKIIKGMPLVHCYDKLKQQNPRSCLRGNKKERVDPLCACPSLFVGSTLLCVRHIRQFLKFDTWSMMEAPVEGLDGEGEADPSINDIRDTSMFSTL